MTEEEHKQVVEHELRLAGRFLRFFPRTKVQWIGPLAAAAMGGVLVAAFVLISGIFSFSASQAPAEKPWKPNR